MDETCPLCTGGRGGGGASQPWPRSSPPRRRAPLTGRGARGQSAPPGVARSLPRSDSPAVPPGLLPFDLLHEEEDVSSSHAGEAARRRAAPHGAPGGPGRSASPAPHAASEAVDAASELAPSEALLRSCKPLGWEVRSSLFSSPFSFDQKYFIAADRARAGGRGSEYARPG
jgi:hypothetical protein